MRRESRWLTLRASYSEDPEVETRRIGVDFDPDDFPLPPPDDFSFLSAFPYVRKDTMFTAIAEGARTHVRLDVYDRKREYIQAPLPDEDTEGVLFNVARDIGRDLYGEIEVRYEDILRGQQTIPTPGPVVLSRLRPGRNAAPELGGVPELPHQRRSGFPGAFRRSRIRR